MTTLRKSETLTPELSYKLMRSKEVEKASDCVGYTGTPTDFIIYENGEYTITAIAFEDGKMLATNSKTLRGEVEMMIEAFGKIPKIRIIDGVAAKTGRKYVTVELA